MDWQKVKTAPTGRGEPPAPTHLETCWRMRSPSGRIVSCGIYRTEGPGLEVRAGFSEDDLLRSQRTAEIGAAREIAEQWRQAVLARGGFEEVRSPDLPS